MTKSMFEIKRVYNVTWGYEDTENNKLHILGRSTITSVQNLTAVQRMALKRAQKSVQGGYFMNMKGWRFPRESDKVCFNKSKICYGYNVYQVRLEGEKPIIQWGNAPR